MADYTSWHVGMKVVCVDSPWEVGPNHPYLPKEGTEYTVSSIFSAPDVDVGIALREMPFGLAPDGLPYGFEAKHFRPLQNRKTDISIFTAMLEPSKVRADA